MLPSIASLLGSCSSIKQSLQEPYSENFSIFTLCISPPSSGKSQAFKYGAKIPLTHVEKVNEGACILLDKFTDAGLRQHLLKYGGLAVIIKDEMYDALSRLSLLRRRYRNSLPPVWWWFPNLKPWEQFITCQHWANVSIAWRIYAGQKLFVQSLSSHGVFTEWISQAFPVCCCQTKGHNQKRNTGNIKRDQLFPSTEGGEVECIGGMGEGYLEVYFLGV